MRLTLIQKWYARHDAAYEAYLDSMPTHQGDAWEQTGEYLNRSMKYLKKFSEDKIAALTPQHAADLFKTAQQIGRFAASVLTQAFTDKNVPEHIKSKAREVMWEALRVEKTIAERPDWDEISILTAKRLKDLVGDGSPSPIIEEFESLLG